MHKKGILFLTLRTFSATGGIEKVCRLAGKALYDISQQPGRQPVKILSLYDSSKDLQTAYFPAGIFSGYQEKKAQFLSSVLKIGFSKRTVILSHINLLVVGYMLTLINPGIQLVLIAHGIEVWHNLPWWKRKMLHRCNLILPVSSFTKTTMTGMYGLPPEKLVVLNNCLDPFLPPLANQDKDPALLKQYNIQQGDKVLFTLTRLASNEQYKGYDNVIKALGELKAEMPHIKYLVAGKYDDAEKARLDKLIAFYNLQDKVTITGFISDADLAKYFQLADVYIMPSQKEGFGIVFIEALFYNKPVIAGNLDGTTDALKNGELGVLVNPNSEEEITAAIKKVLCNTNAYLPPREKVMGYFGFDVYKKKLAQLLQQPPIKA